MRILHVVTNLWRCNGVMSVVMNYLRKMPADIRFDVMYFDELPDHYKDELAALGGRAIKVAPPGLHSMRHDEVDDFLEAHRGTYAAMHLHLPYLASFFAPKARRHGIAQVLVHCHSTWFSLEPRNALRNRVLNIPTRFLADKELACGRDAGVFWYGKRAVESGRVLILANAVESEKYRIDPALREATRRGLGIDEGQLVIGHVGRSNHPQKNHPFLLRIFAAVLAQQPEAVLLMAGAEETEELCAQGEALGMREKLRYLGNRSDIPALLQAMDVFLFPSLYEGLPVAGIEAQAAGLGCVMSDAITAEAQVLQTAVRLPLSQPPERWAAEVLRQARAPKTTDAGACLRQAGFDLEENAKRLCAVYRGKKG